MIYRVDYQRLTKLGPVSQVNEFLVKFSEMYVDWRQTDGDHIFMRGFDLGRLTQARCSPAVEPEEQIRDAISVDTETEITFFFLMPPSSKYSKGDAIEAYMAGNRIVIKHPHDP